MKTKHSLLVLVFFISAFAACNDGSRGSDNNNSQEMVPDSMPVVDPGLSDTSSVITPPQTNDQNNAYPDTIQ